MSKNEIIVPEKRQFEHGEQFYGTLFHEMTHSTGIEGVLDRIKRTEFGSEEYAREELGAELGAALVAQRYGMTRHIKEDSCAYLKSWLDKLKESPQFIKTTLVDVKRASAMITQRVDRIAQEIELGQREEQKEEVEKKDDRSLQEEEQRVEQQEQADETQTEEQEEEAHRGFRR